jgi:hypothetical protein
VEVLGKVESEFRFGVRYHLKAMIEEYKSAENNVHERTATSETRKLQEANWGGEKGGGEVA